MKMYQVDAFTKQLFKGNPAAVIVTEQWLDDILMQILRWKTSWYWRRPCNGFNPYRNCTALGGKTG